MNGRAWSELELAELRELYPNVKTAVLAKIFGRGLSAIYGQAAKLGIEKSAAYLAGPDACRLRRGDNVGAPHRFPKGHVPANKGLRRPGWAPGRMRETQFKKGNATNWMPVGSTRLVDGYVYLKVADVRNVVHTVNWKPLHILNWERANGGELPAGHCLAFRDRNRLNTEISNLELITRAEHMRRHTLHQLPKPLKRAIYARSALVRRINRTEKANASHA